MQTATHDFTHRISRYARELEFCFNVGADLKNKLQLAGSTIKFHSSNFGKATENNIDQRVGNYTIKRGCKTFKLQMRQLGGDFFIFHEIFLNETYKMPAEWCHNVGTIIDLGANIGLTTIYFANLFPTARFVCVEPNPTNVPLLRHNLLFLADKVTVVEGAISDHSGPGFLRIDHAAYGAQLDNGCSTGSAVQLYTMQELLDNLNIKSVDILKIDVEGAEKDLFHKDTEWLRLVKTIVIELHGEYSLDQFTADMDKNGFAVFVPDASQGNNMLVARNIHGLNHINHA